MESFLFQNLAAESEQLLNLHAAASIGCYQAVLDIIRSCGGNYNIVNSCNEHGWTPLMYAAHHVNKEIALLLLETGAQPEIQNYEGQTALMLASRSGCGDLIYLLINFGASSYQTDLRGWTAVFYAIQFGHRSVLQALIENGALVDIVDYEGITPLMLAAAVGNQGIVEDLLQLGVKVNIESKSGESARSLAFKNSNFDIYRLICSYLQSESKTIDPSRQNLDLFSLLNELNLLKYYYVFKDHNIDINTFWLLTDDDLKAIGIDLLGPRKKLCMAISEYQQKQLQNSAPREAANLDTIFMENKNRYTDKFTVLQEKQSVKTEECNLAYGNQTVKNYEEMYKSILGHGISFLQKLRKNQLYLKSLLCSTFQDMDSSSTGQLKRKKDYIFESLDYLQRLVDVQQHNLINLQQNNYHK